MDFLTVLLSSSTSAIGNRSLDSPKPQNYQNKSILISCDQSVVEFVAGYFYVAILTVHYCIQVTTISHKNARNVPKKSDRSKLYHFVTN